MPKDVQEVRGEIYFGEGGEAFSGATAYVRLEEVSRADAPSRIVAEQIIHPVNWRPGQSTMFTFALSGPAPDGHARYIVSVHLDLNGDGQVSRGDFITMESYPVPTRGNASFITVQLRKIK